MNEKQAELIRVRQYINDLANMDKNYARKILFEISSKDKIKINEYIKKINHINNKMLNEKDKSKKGELTFEKGKLLEHIANTVININNLYESFTNIRCASNEIDILAIPASNCWMCYELLPDFMKDNIIIECKNYNKNIPVTWVGKLYSLIRYKNVKSAILFSYKPLSGSSPWEDAKGLANKLFLRDQTIIINITVSEVESIINGTSEYCNIIELINNKVNEIQFQTDIEKDISKHPAEIGSQN